MLEQPLAPNGHQTYGIPATVGAESMGLVRETLLCLTLMSAQLFTQASLGNVILPLHIIGEDLGSPHTPDGDRQLPWCVAAYSLTVGSFILVTGKVGDVFGHKKVYMTGMIYYGLISLLIGFSAFLKSIDLFILLRGFQGIGPAIVLPNGVALLAQSYPQNGPRKAFVFAMFGAAAPLGFVSGAAVGSFFAQVVWWPWAQWILGILCLFVASAGWILIPEPESEANNEYKEVIDDSSSLSAATPEMTIDYLGASLAILGLVSIVFAFNQGPVVGWDVTYVWLSLVGGVILLGLFVIVEGRVAQPIMPLDVWTQPGFPGIIMAMVFGWGSFGVFNFYSIQLMEVFRGTTPLATSAQLVPLFIFGLMATLVMWFMHARVKGQHLLAIAMSAFCLGNVFLVLCPVDSTYWTYLFAAMCVTPFGMDLSYPSASLLVSNALPPERQGVGASMINTAVNVAISLGLGIAGTVERIVESSSSAADSSDTLRVPQGALYAGVALAGLGLLISVFFTRVAEPTTTSGREYRIQDDLMELSVESATVIS